MEHEHFTSVQKHTLPINQGRGLFPSLTLAAVLHWHRGQLSAEEANKGAHFLLGEPNAARLSAITGAW